MKKFTYTFSEFFAGIGLVRMGLEKAGWKIRYANDIDASKHRLYSYHFGNDNNYELGDIHEVDVDKVPQVDVATASFPCTDLSLAGKRDGLDGKHSSAFWGFIRIIYESKVKPKFLLLENVEGFLSSKKGKDLEEALVAINGLGYGIDIFIVNAKHFTPQSRSRFFILATRNDLIKNVSNNYSDLNVSDVRPKKVIDFINAHGKYNWCIKKLPKLPSLKMDLNEIIDDIPDNSKDWWNNERTEYLINQTSEKHLAYINDVKFDPEFHYMTAFRRVRNGRSMAEVRNDGIAGCLRTPKGGSARQILIRSGRGSVKVKYMSATEYAKLMGAPEFKLSGSSTECLFGFGDAVCVPVLEWIGINYLNSRIEELESVQFEELQHA